MSDERGTLTNGPSANVPTLRDRIHEAWNRVMSPVQGAPMPPAVFDATTRPGQQMMIDRMANDNPRSIGGEGTIPYVSQMAPNPYADDIGGYEAFKIAAGEPMGSALNFGRQATLNAQYLAAAIAGSQNMPQLGQDVEHLKQERAANDYYMRQLGVAHPLSTAAGGMVGNAFVIGGIDEAPKRIK